MSHPVARRVCAAALALLVTLTAAAAADAAVVTGPKKIKHPSSGLVLGTMDDSLPYPGTYVMLRPDTGDKTQKWTFTTDGHEVQIRNLAASNACINQGAWNLMTIAPCSTAGESSWLWLSNLGDGGYHIKTAPSSLPAVSHGGTNAPVYFDVTPSYDAEYRWVFSALPTPPAPEPVPSPPVCNVKPSLPQCNP